MTDQVLEAQTVFKGSLEPMAVGKFRDRHGENQLLPFSQPEFDRAIADYRNRLSSFHFRTGNEVLVTSLFSEGAQFAPLERSIFDYGLVLLSADASFFDAARIESILRRFECVAVAGITSAVLDGLKALGFEAEKLLANRVVWARPDAYERLSGTEEINLRLWAEVGPAISMQCAHGEGGHINRLEWKIDVDDREIVLTSRLHRSLNFQRYYTGVRARVEYAACPCGSADPRIFFE